MNAADIEVTFDGPVTAEQTADLLRSLALDGMESTLRHSREGGRVLSLTAEDAPDAETAAGRIMGTLAEIRMDWQTLTVRAGGRSIHFYPSTTGIEVAA